MLGTLSRTLLPSLGAALDAACPALTHAVRAASSAASKDVAAPAKTNWAALAQALPKQSKDVPTATGGAAFPGDLRATSALSIGDGIKDHTSKWLQVGCRGLYAPGAHVLMRVWYRATKQNSAPKRPRPVCSCRATRSRQCSTLARLSPSRWRATWLPHTAATTLRWAARCAGVWACPCTWNSIGCCRWSGVVPSPPPTHVPSSHNLVLS